MQQKVMLTISISIQANLTNLYYFVIIPTLVKQSNHWNKGFSAAEDSESVGMPHLMMEHKLGLL
ncbi:hypothetical protein KSF78_0009676 [Schistosoma japonicum]|nr:hypothetical protein KSF78_0009676 [Schistosoma japonicum]